MTLHFISKDLGLDFSRAHRSGLEEGKEILRFAGEALEPGDTRMIRRQQVRILALIGVELIRKGCRVTKTQAREEVAEIINDTVSGILRNDKVAPSTIKDLAVREPRPEPFADLPLPPEGMSPKNVRYEARRTFKMLALAARAVEASKSAGS